MDIFSHISADSASSAFSFRIFMDGWPYRFITICLCNINQVKYTLLLLLKVLAYTHTVVSTPSQSYTSSEICCFFLQNAMFNVLIYDFFFPSKCSTMYNSRVSFHFNIQKFHWEDNAVIGSVHSFSRSLLDVSAAAFPGTHGKTLTQPF